MARGKVSTKEDSLGTSAGVGLIGSGDSKGCHLSPYQRQELFVAWAHEQREKYVSQTCNVDLSTVARYRKLDKWDERIALITAGIAEKIDEMLAASLVVQLHEVMVLRQRAYLEAMKGSFKDARQAFQSYVELSKLEKEIKPQASAGEGDDVLAIARRIFSQRKLKDGARVVREIAADVLPGGSGKQEACEKAANKATVPLTDALSGEVSPEVPIVAPGDNLGPSLEPDEFNENAKQRVVILRRKVLHDNLPQETQEDESKGDA